MPVETETDVEQMRTVQAADGSTRPPADADAQGNWDSLEAFEYTTSTTDPEQLPQRSVPDGVTLVVAFRSGNADVVHVGNDVAQPATLTSVGDAFHADLSDSSQIYIQTPTAGDGVGVLYET